MTNVANSSRLVRASLLEDNHNAEAHEPDEKTAGRYGDRPPLAATQDRSNTAPEGNRRTRPAGSGSRQLDGRQIPDNDYGIRTPH